MAVEQKNNNHSIQPALPNSKKFLFVSWESLSGDLAWQIQKEGHQVKIYIKNPEDADVYDGFLEKVQDWKANIDWADVIVFDDTGFGYQADHLRKSGKLVVGGSMYTDRLEDDREFGQAEMKQAGLLTLPHWDFNNYDQAIDFLDKNPGRYVYKPSGSVASDRKGLLFLGEEEDGKDIREILSHNQKLLERKIKQFQLQKFASGVEVAVGAFFNGEDFIYPVNINFEHKKLFPGDIGPYTGEMGTLMYWSVPNTIFHTTLEKMKEKFKESAYVGYLDINCIANARGIYPLEFTCFSDDTEILTEQGWKMLKDVTINESVATLHPKIHSLQYQRVRRKIAKQHRGQMIHIAGAGKKHEALDCLVTPDHQMYIQKRNGTYGFVRADAIPQGSKIKRTCHWSGKDVETYTVPGYTEQHFLGRYKIFFPIEHPPVTMPMGVWLRFLGIFLAEGSNGCKGRTVNISQFTKKREVRNLLKGFPFPVKECKGGVQISSTQLSRHLLSYQFGKCNTKYVPHYVKSLSPEYIKIFLDAFRVGDGSIHPRTGQISYFSTSKRMIDDIQELLLKCGIVGNIGERNSAGTPMRDFSYKRRHNLYWISERHIKKQYYIDKRNIRYVPYHGMVYCVEVPNHIIYVRRNGRPFWCGNCRFGYPTISVQMEAVLSQWGDFLYGLASKASYELKVKKGFQIGVVCAVPPFPYDDKSEMDIYKDSSIIFKKQNTDSVHLGDVKFVDGDWRIAGNTGYALVVTGSGLTVAEARAQTYSRIKNIMLQNMFYRTDIGMRWMHDSDKLQTWGYLY